VADAGQLGGVVAVGAVAAVYRHGVARAWADAGRGRVVRPRQVACAAGGLVAAAIAVLPAVDAAADRGLVAHMVQHVLLLAVAPPLLAVSGLLPAIVWALPARWQPRARAAWRHGVRLQSDDGRWFAWVAATFVVMAATMWVWHAPVLYDATLRSLTVHALEHATFVVTSTAFWWVVAAGRRSRRGAATFAVFAAGLPGTALGAAMLLAPNVWYPAYAARASSTSAALADQQLAGVVMWAVAGLVYVVAAAVLVWSWLADADRRFPSRAVGGLGAVVVALGLTVTLAGCGGNSFTPTRVVQGGDADVGHRLIEKYDCGRCHTIPGIKGADGLVGPPLIKFGRRSYIAGELENTPGNLIRWIRHPRQVEPGTDMPDLGVSTVEARSIAAYLESLG
jgi:cytochrome c oxidase assembly factor CtaG/cytochrome c2